jgi:predicted TIM-barrel fold metal-dependent hydrolase
VAVQDDIFVIDGVAHAFNMSDENLADQAYADPCRRLQADFMAEAQPPGYGLERSATLKDWPVDDSANLLFSESNTDVAIFHPVPIYFFKDGYCSIDKAVEATKRWPNRFIGSYIAIDPLRPDPLGEMERQFELLDNPVGLKLYPVSFFDDVVTPWRMDDPKIGFPLYEKARSLGLKCVAIHKSLPLGPAPSGGGAAFHPGDVEGAAVAFPDMTFSIVHGGMSFTEETAWLLARYENIWINMETLNLIGVARPRVYGDMMAALLGVAGEAAIDRIYWASGAMQCHPQPGLDALIDFQFTDEQMETHGLFFPIPQLTREHKQKLLGGNIARLHGLDIGSLAKAIEGDEFAGKSAEGFPPPWSTTSVADAVLPPGAPAPGITSVGVAG